MSNPKDNDNTNLSIKETFQILKYIPDFKKSVIISLIGIVAAFSTILFVDNKTKLIISIIGCLISYSGFDQISKIIATIKNTSIDECKEIINDLESKKNKK
ncbi:MAG: hypothetical protein ACOWWR_18255 [Eubacteriales bacterium]